MRLKLHKNTLMIFFVIFFVVVLIASRSRTSITQVYNNTHQPLEATVSALMVRSQKELANVRELSAQKHLSRQQQQELYGNLQAAIGDARNASDARPDVAATWINLSEVYQQFIGKDFQNADQFAIGALQQAIKADPKNYLPYYQLGLLYLQLHDDKEAKDFLQQAYLLVPENDTKNRLSIQQQLQKL